MAAANTALIPMIYRYHDDHQYKSAFAADIFLTDARGRTNMNKEDKNHDESL